MPPPILTPEQAMQIAASNVRLAESVLALSQSNTQLAKRVERQVELLEQTRSALSKTLENRDTDNFAIHTLLREINTNLALMSQGVNNVERDVREATDPRLNLRAQQREHAEEEGDRRAGSVVKGLNIFNKMSLSTKILLITLVVVSVFAFVLARKLGGG